MPATGLVDSFLQAFTNVSELHRQRELDKQAAIQQSVQNAMEQHRLDLQKEQIQATERDREAQLKATKSYHEMLGQLAQGRLDVSKEAQDRLAKSEQDRNANTALIHYQNQLRFYTGQGYPDAQARAAKDVMGMPGADSLPYEVLHPLPGPALKLSPMAEATLNLKTATTDKIKQDLEAKVQIDADRHADSVAHRQHLANQDALAKRQVDSLLPLKVTAKRLGIDLDRMRARKMAVDTVNAELEGALKRVRLDKEKHPERAIGDAKSLAKFADDNMKLNDQVRKNAHTQVVHLTEEQTKLNEVIVMLKKKGDQRSADENAKLIGYLQGYDERAQKIREYAKEEADAKTAVEHFHRMYGQAVGVYTSSVAPNGSIKPATVPTPDAPRWGQTRIGEIPRITSKVQYDKLPKGFHYIAPDGKEHIKK